MKLFTHRRPSAGTLIAVAALTFALAGTAIAADPVERLTRAKVKKIANKQITKRAPGLSVANAVNATNANNANNLGGQAAGVHLRSNACQSGSVLGFARIDGDEAGFPATYTTNPAFIQITRNCSGQSVEVRRSSTGHFLVRFNGNPAALAVATANTDESVIGENNIMAVGKIGAGPDAGAFNVTVANEPANNFEDADFTIVLP